MQGASVNTGLPAALFTLYAWASVNFYPLPSGNADTLELAKTLRLPTLLIQDPEDPVTRLPFAQELAQANNYIDLHLAASPRPDAQCLANKGRWGSHVAAFKCDNIGVIAALNDYLSALGILAIEAGRAASES